MRKLLLLSLITFATLNAESINTQDTAFRTSFESVKISDDEDMGLVGIAYLFEPNDYFYYGLNIYGTLWGERGGFFTGGLITGLKYPIYKNLYLDSGVFVGAGGGGSAPQGGGLMLKAYLGALYQFDEYSLGLNYSRVKFPNGDIDSSGVSVVADVKFDTLFIDMPLNPEVFSNYNFTNSKDYFTPTLQYYIPNDGTKKVNGSALDENIGLIGIEYGAYVSGNILAYFESAGAFSGESTGYMEVLGGLGYSLPLAKSTNLQAKVSLGSAGGGQVNTGGGAVSKASLNLNYNPTKHINAGLALGTYHAFEGNFDATTARVNIGINTNFVSLSKSKSSLDYSFVNTQKFNVRVAHQSYLASDTLRANSNEEAVHLIGFKVDYFLTDNFYASGQASSAYSGEAGGYMAGMFGLGYIQPLIQDLGLVGEFNFGASGGGSLQSGNGMTIQPMVGLIYNLTKKSSIEVLYGKIMAIEDNYMNTGVVDIAFVYRFDKLTLK